MQDFNANLSTGKWLVSSENIAGVTCDGKVIVLLPNAIDSKEFLSTVCHEGGHAIFPDLSEAEVERMSRDMTEILWGLGYRLKKKRKKRSK